MINVIVIFVLFILLEITFTTTTALKRVCQEAFNRNKIQSFVIHHKWQYEMRQDYSEELPTQHFRISDPFLKCDNRNVLLNNFSDAISRIKTINPFLMFILAEEI